MVLAGSLAVGAKEGVLALLVFAGLVVAPVWGALCFLSLSSSSWSARILSVRRAATAATSCSLWLADLRFWRHWFRVFLRPWMWAMRSTLWVALILAAPTFWRSLIRSAQKRHI